MDKPPLSILIPWCARDELRMTLITNGPYFRELEAEVLILNCAGDSACLRQLVSDSGITGIRQLDIAAPRFNKSLALNVGIAYSQADTVFVLDADITLLKDALAGAIAFTKDGCFVTIEWVYESEPPAGGVANATEAAGNLSSLTNDFVAAIESSAFLTFHLRDGRTVEHQVSRKDFLGTKRAAPGLLLAAKQQLLDIHGYNSALQTWGWEDDDVLVRLQHVLGLRRIQQGEALHLTHGDDRRILRGSRRQSDQLNFMKCCRNYNSGNFLGTYQADVAWATGRVCECR